MLGEGSGVDPTLLEPLVWRAWQGSGTHHRVRDREQLLPLRGPPVHLSGLWPLWYQEWGALPGARDQAHCRAMPGAGTLLPPEDPTHCQLPLPEPGLAWPSVSGWRLGGQAA